jgi:hypothetical protein
MYLWRKVHIEPIGAQRICAGLGKGHNPCCCLFLTCLLAFESEDGINTVLRNVDRLLQITRRRIPKYDIFHPFLNSGIRQTKMEADEYCLRIYGDIT